MACAVIRRLPIFRAYGSVQKQHVGGWWYVFMGAPGGWWEGRGGGRRERGKVEGKEGEQNVEENRKEASQRSQSIPYKVGLVNTTQSGKSWLGVAKCWPGPSDMITTTIQCGSACLLCTGAMVGRVAGLPVLWSEIG